MTVNELALQLIREQDEGSDNTDFVEVVEQWVEDALDEFASAFDWRLFKTNSTITTVASQSDYDLAANVREIRSLRFTDTDEPIEYVDAQRLHGIAEDLEREGKPQFWFYKESETAANPLYTIQIVPIPDAIYTLQALTITHPTLTPLTSAVLPLQQEMILCLKNRVRAYVLASDKDYDGSDRYLQQFYSKVNQLIQRESAPVANNIRMQVRDISNTRERRLARLDPTHFS